MDGRVGWHDWGNGVRGLTVLALARHLFLPPLLSPLLLGACSWTIRGQGSKLGASVSLMGSSSSGSSIALAQHRSAVITVAH